MRDFPVTPFRRGGTGKRRTDDPDTAHRMGRLGSPVVLANAQNFPALPNTEPYIIRRFGDLSIGIMGLTVATQLSSSHSLCANNKPAATIADPMDVARDLVPELRESVNLLVVLSHLGTDFDARLANSVPGIDLIIGGHSHHCLFEPLFARDTAIVQAGPQGAYLGVVDIEEDRSPTGFSISGRLELVWQDIRPDQNLEKRISQYYRDSYERSDEEVGETPGCWANPWSENRWSNFILDGIRRDTAAEVAIIKAMMIYPAQDPGPFYWYDADRSVPGIEWLELKGFDNLVTLTVPGRVLQYVFEHAVSNLTWSTEGDITESRACGPGNTILQVSGTRIEYDVSRKRGERVLLIEINGEPLRDERVYSVGTTEFLAKGYSGFRWLGDAKRLDSHCGLRESIECC